MTKRENDFTVKVKKLLAECAGYKCSVPYCNKITIGPEKNNREKSSNSGMACHIYAASENGPRFKNDETKEFIQSIDNGIWCCYNHGKIIDNNNN